MADLGAIARLLVRGGGTLADAARAEARRVLEELVARGDLGREEAARLETAVAEAAETHRRWLDERVAGPLRELLRGAAEAVGRGADDELRARLAALEERLARIEQALAGRGGG